MHSEPSCCPMKSHLEARERSIGLGLQSAVCRTSSPEPLPEPALTRRVRASQLSTSPLPAAVSGRLTVFEPLWRKLSLRVLVSAAKRGSSKVDERPVTATSAFPPRLTLTVTLASREPLPRIAR